MKELLHYVEYFRDGEFRVAAFGDPFDAQRCASILKKQGATRVRVVQRRET